MPAISHLESEVLRLPPLQDVLPDPPTAAFIRQRRLIPFLNKLLFHRLVMI